MTQENSNLFELVSALADGELSGDEFAQTLDWLEVSDEARARWRDYHLVGELLRSGEQAALQGGDPGFVVRLRARLQAQRTSREPLTATDLFAQQAQARGPGAIRGRQEQSSNDASLRWKLMAGVATLAAMAVLSWELVGTWVAPTAGSQLARVEVQRTLEQPPVMIRDPQLDSFLAAHQQSGGISALHKPAGFLRNATYDRSEH